MRGTSLAEALEKVRLNYGEDALVLRTRRVLVRSQDDLAPTPQIEVVVVDPEGEPESHPSTEDPVAGQLARLERLAHRVEELSGDVRRVMDADSNYPLETELRRAGVTEETLREIASSFALASVRGSQGATAARRHLQTILRGLRRPDLEHMRGEHWFLGRGGSGKTTLVLHLAARLRRRGRSVALIALAPPHEGAVHRLEAAARALDVTAAVAWDPAELDELRSHLGGNELLLVDTPCCFRQPLPAQPGPLAQRHLVTPLGEDPILLRELLARNGAPEVDTLGITQMDLCPRRGRLLDLARAVGRPVAFLMGTDGSGAPELSLASPEGLIESILGPEEAIRSREAVA